jgi:hypothetical protein
VRRILISFALIGLFASWAAANQLCVNDGNLASYITNYSTFGTACQIGDKLFWGFSLSTGSQAIGAEPAASDIQVQSHPGDGLSNIGIVFNTGGWAVSSGIPLDQIISYNVATASGVALIEDATLVITGNLTGSGGSAQVTETLTPAVAGSPMTASLPGNASSHITFLGNLQTSFHVTNEILLVGGPGFADLAHVSVMENDFSELVGAPEPMTMGLIGAGLMLFGVARRRRITR